MGPFVPKWNIYNESWLSICANTIEFARHAFPPVVVADMDAIANIAFSHNISYAIAQAMFYLVAGSRCIQRLGELERVHTNFVARESKYKLQIT